MTDGEPIPTNILETKAKEIPLPVGERVIGHIDPRTLNEEEFNSSPELLLHAAAKPFSFSPDADYSTLPTDFSSTAGRGLYTTDDPVIAQKYLEHRKLTAGGENAVLMNFLPHQACMYDMRAQNDMKDNAPVPKDFFEKYRQFVIDYFKSKFPESVAAAMTYHSPEYSFYEVLRQHKAFLNQLYFANGAGNYKPVDIHVMLGVDGTANTSEKGSIPFTLFMLKEGYDGFICNQGGDGWEETAASYVFYNPKKVGTYDTWHQ